MEVVETTRTSLVTIIHSSFDQEARASTEPIVVQVRSIVEQLKSSGLELTHIYEEEHRVRQQRQKELKQLLGKSGISPDYLQLFFGTSSEETAKSHRYSSL